jgi:sigma-B regulation protein RsbU (phosphoserine phosphatase)
MKMAELPPQNEQPHGESPEGARKIVAQEHVNDPRPPKPLWIWANLLLVATVFVADYRTPDAYHINYLYNICIALTIWSWHPRWVLAITALTVFSSLAAHEIQHEVNPAIDAFNMTMGLSVQVLTGVLIWLQVLAQRRFEINQRYARHHEAALLAAERRAREEAERTEELARRHATELATALADARRAMWQAQEAIQREREARRRESAAREREMKASGDLERIKNLSVALHNAVLPAVPRETSNGRIRLGAQYSPAERDILIGGDFYDVLLLDPDGDRVGLVIGDVAGHGVEAAAQTALVTTTLRAYAMDSGGSPARIMSRTARLIDTQLESFVSLFFGIYDLRTRTLTYANAGHEPPIVIYKNRPQMPEPLEPTGSILGVGLIDFDEASVHLDPGDLLVMLTDGLTEVRTGGGAMLGWDGVAAIATDRATHLSDAQMIADGIVSDVRWVSRNQRLSDDVALLVAFIADPS